MSRPDRFDGVPDTTPGLLDDVRKTVDRVGGVEREVVLRREREGREGREEPEAPPTDGSVELSAAIFSVYGPDPRTIPHRQIRPYEDRIADRVDSPRDRVGGSGHGDRRVREAVPRVTAHPGAGGGR